MKRGPVISLAATTLPALLTTVSSEALASETAYGPGALPVPAPGRDKPASQPSVSPLVSLGDKCTELDVRPVDAAAPVGCVFGLTTLGVKFSLEKSSGPTKIAIDGFASRGSRGSLDMDRILQPRNIGLAEETTLFGVQSKAEFLDGAIAVENTMIWSRNWSSPQHEPSLLVPARLDTRSGYAQSHRISVKPIDRKKLSWSITLDYASASAEFLPRDVRNPYQIAAFAGSRTAIASKLKRGDVRFSAKTAGQTFPFGRAGTDSVGLGFKGIELTYKRRTSETAPFAVFAAIPVTQSLRRQFDIDANLYELAPAIAVDESFPAIMLPKMFRASFERGYIRQGANPLAGGLADAASAFHESSRHALDLMGMWETPLGDTLINYRRENRMGVTGTARDQRDTMLMATHSFRTGKFRVSLDATVMRSRTTSKSTSTSNSAFFGGSVRYELPGKLNFDMKIGRDYSTYDLDGGFLSNRDTSLRIEAGLDLSEAVRKVIGPGTKLRVDYRQRASRNSFAYGSEIGDFPGLLKGGTDFVRRSAFLVTFSMKLPRL